MHESWVRVHDTTVLPSFWTWRLSRGVCPPLDGCLGIIAQANQAYFDIRLDKPSKYGVPQGGRQYGQAPCS